MDDERGSELRELLAVFKKRPQPDPKDLLAAFRALSSGVRMKMAEESLRAYEKRNILCDMI